MIATALSKGSEVVSLITSIFYSVIFFQKKTILCCPILHFLRAVFSARVLIFCSQSFPPKFTMENENFLLFCRRLQRIDLFFLLHLLSNKLALRSQIDGQFQESMSAVSMLILQGVLCSVTPMFKQCWKKQQIISPP